MKKIFIFLLALMLVFPFIASCKESGEISSNAESDAAEGAYDNMPNIVQIEMEDGGRIIVELYPDIAPITVRNFKKLVSEGFYDGLIFHRVISGFMIQGGDPKGTGTGGSGVTIKGEFSANGVKNTLSHSRGVISMARSDPFNSASSQFFIMHADDTGLDGKYAAFGKVLEGMDVVDRIAAVKVNKNNKPLTEQRMKRVTLLNNYTAGESSENTSQEQSENDSSVTDTSD